MREALVLMFFLLISVSAQAYKVNFKCEAMEASCSNVACALQDALASRYGLKYVINCDYEGAKKTLFLSGASAASGGRYCRVRAIEFRGAAVEGQPEITVGQYNYYKFANTENCNDVAISAHLSEIFSGWFEVAGVRDDELVVIDEALHQLAGKESLASHLKWPLFRDDTYKRFLDVIQETPDFKLVNVSRSKENPADIYVVVEAMSRTWVLNIILSAGGGWKLGSVAAPQ